LRSDGFSYALRRFISRKTPSRCSFFLRDPERLIDSSVVERSRVSVEDAFWKGLRENYALDLWAVRWRQRETTGDMIIVRYAERLPVAVLSAGDRSAPRLPLAAG
jgi:hypothetical protein